MRKYIVGIVVGIIAIVMILWSIDFAIKKFTGETNPDGWVVSKFTDECKVKMPSDYKSEITYNSKKSEYCVKIYDKRKIKYIGWFEDEDTYINKKVVEKKVYNYSLKYATENVVVYNSSNYSNSGEWKQKDIVINDKKYKTVVIEIANTFFSDKDDMYLILVDLSPDKNSCFIADNITRNMFCTTSLCGWWG